MLYEAAAFLGGQSQEHGCLNHTFRVGSETRARTHTHLCKVVYESQMGLLQLCARQRRQGVGIVQLSAVVRWKQVWIQADHMSRICKPEGTFITTHPTC